MEINLNNATFIGEGEWIQDTAYQVYELDGRYYAVVVVGHSNKEVIDDMTIEIKKEDIGSYI